MPVLRMILKFLPRIFGAQRGQLLDISMYRSLSGRSRGPPHDGIPDEKDLDDSMTGTGKIRQAVLRVQLLISSSKNRDVNLYISPKKKRRRKDV